MANVLKYTGVTLAAGMAGAVLALLFAPASGAVTRRRLAYRIDEKRHEMSERGRAVRESLEESRRRLAAVVNTKKRDSDINEPLDEEGVSLLRG